MMINLTNSINIYYFLISFFIGMLLVYILEPLPEIIIKYPSPDTNIVYKDESDLCYIYENQEVPCDSSAIDFPLQHKINNLKKNNKGVIQSFYDKFFKK